MSVVLSVQNLTKSYGGRPVIDDVSIDVPVGGISGFLGPNGAGKTTLMSIVVGLVPPDRGKITLLDHQDGHRCRSTRSRIGFLQEKPCIYPEMSLWSYIKFFANLYGVENAAARCHNVIRLVGLSGHNDRSLGRLSRGMQQRACLARVLLHQPELLILDEPTLGLDPLGVIEMREIFLSLREQGITILFSSHQLAEMERICDHVILMNEGRIAAAGTRKDILGHSGLGRRFLIETFEPATVALNLFKSKSDGAEAAVAGEHKLLVTVFDLAQKEDIREARARLSARLTSAGATILSIEPEGGSLEDMFVRLAGSRRNMPESKLVMN